jgi:2-polyprenyl-3-methyl-5-hydroxy-6-metoxy-1,4-benzoquinol methylase
MSGGAGAGGAFRRREAELVEWMDRPDCDPERLRATYRDFAVVNRWISRPHRLFRRFVLPLGRGLRARGRPVEVVDVGCGGGDLARDFLARAHRAGIPIRMLGVDPDPRAIDFARKMGLPADGSLRFEVVRGEELLERGERFDVAVSNHVLHHLDDAAVPGFLGTLQALTRRCAVASDIRRSRAAHLLFGAATAPFFRDSYIRADGLLSIRRSFSDPELAALVPAGWQVRRAAPFRLLATFDRGAA